VPLDVIFVILSTYLFFTVKANHQVLVDVHKGGRVISLIHLLSYLGTM